jgi:hypothetical protein
LSEGRADCIIYRRTRLTLWLRQLGLEIGVYINSSRNAPSTNPRRREGLFFG